MSDNAAQDPISAPHPLRCSSMTKGGKECRAYPVKGSTTCLLHGDREQVAELSKRAAAESARVRKDSLEQRKAASEDAKLSLTQRLRRATAARADEFVNATLDNAIGQKDVGAQRLVWERLEGKVTDNLNVNAGDPFSMSEADLHRWLTEAPQEPVEAPSESL